MTWFLCRVKESLAPLGSWHWFTPESLSSFTPSSQLLLKISIEKSDILAKFQQAMDAWNTRAVVYVFVSSEWLSSCWNPSSWASLKCWSAAFFHLIEILRSGILFTHFVHFICRSRCESGGYFEGRWNSHFIPAQRCSSHRICGRSAGPFTDPPWTGDLCWFIIIRTRKI